MPTQVENVAPVQVPAPPQAKVPRPVKAPAKARRTFGISLYRAWCKHCGICAEFCPTHALQTDEWGNPFVADEARCAGCLQCMHRCPDFCIEVYERVSLGADESRRGSAAAAESEHEGE
jgi:2-oxoglutarate ferredoxin oxidoreductase subunit delta